MMAGDQYQFAGRGHESSPAEQDEVRHSRSHDLPAQISDDRRRQVPRSRHRPTPACLRMGCRARCPRAPHVPSLRRCPLRWQTPAGSAVSPALSQKPEDRNHREARERRIASGKANDGARRQTMHTPAAARRNAINHTCGARQAKLAAMTPAAKAREARKQVPCRRNTQAGAHVRGHALPSERGRMLASPLTSGRVPRRQSSGPRATLHIARVRTA